MVEASPHELVGLDDPPGCRQREGGGQLSRRLRQNALCMVGVVVVVLVSICSSSNRDKRDSQACCRRRCRPVGSLHVDVVVADGHVAEGRASGALERREEHVPPVLGELSNHAVAAIADERQDVIHGEDGLLLGAYLPTGKANRITAEQWRMDGQEQNLKAAVVVGEQADPSRARHGLGAHHAVLAAGVPHLNGDGLRHGCPCFRKGGKQTERGLRACCF